MVSLAHPATVTELAVLYAALARSRETSDPIAPTVIFTGLAPGIPDQGIRVRLNGFGITTLTDVELGLVDHEVAALSHASTAEGGRPDRVAYLLGGSLHGWCLRARHHDTDHTHDADAVNDVDDVELVSTIASLLERERLRTFAARAGCPDDPVFTRTHTPGSDSRGVVQFGVGTDSGTRQVVAKIGPRDVITGEVRFNSGVNALLVRKGRPPLFPEVYGVLFCGNRFCQSDAISFPFSAIASMSYASASVTMSPPNPSMTERACFPEPPWDCWITIVSPVFCFQYFTNAASYS